jgi:hypothetical protein
MATATKTPAERALAKLLKTGARNDFQRFVLATVGGVRVTVAPGTAHQVLQILAGFARTEDPYHVAAALAAIQ